LPLCLSKHHTMGAYGRMEAQFHELLRHLHSTESILSAL